MAKVTQRYLDAFEFAAAAHGEQLRKGKDEVPYLSHLMAVSSLVMEYGGDEDQAIAGLLHDAVEDQGGAAMEAKIRERFGDRIADIVRDCTDADPKTKKTALDPEQKRLAWKGRKEAYLAKLAEKSDDALLVSQCDKLHNAMAIVADAHDQGRGFFETFTGKRDGVLWYYQSLTDIFTKRCPGPLAERFARTVDEMKSI